MATIVQISGQPGTGKTWGAKYLPSDKTFIISTDKKGLSWAGWRKEYNKANKNFIETSDIPTIYKLLKGLSDTRPEIKYIMIDTINSITSDMVMLEMKKPNFDKWRELAVDIYELFDMIRSHLRDDLIVFCTAHIEPYEVNGATHYRTKFDGKMLTKLNMNGKLNYNLYTAVEHSGEGNNEYKFITQTDGTTEARSVGGVLPYKLDNNLYEVAKLIEELDLNVLPSETTGS